MTPAPSPGSSPALSTFLKLPGPWGLGPRLGRRRSDVSRSGKPVCEKPQKDPKRSTARRGDEWVPLSDGIFQKTKAQVQTASQLNSIKNLEKS